MTASAPDNPTGSPAANETPSKGGRDFESLARGPQESLLRSVFGYLGQNKKWWLTPIVIVFLFFGALVLAASTSAAPFVYTLF